MGGKPDRKGGDQASDESEGKRDGSVPPSSPAEAIFDEWGGSRAGGRAKRKKRPEEISMDFAVIEGSRAGAYYCM